MTKMILREGRITGQVWKQGREYLGNGCGWKIELRMRKTNRKEDCSRSFKERQQVCGSKWAESHSCWFLCRPWARAARCCNTLTIGWGVSCKMAVSSSAPLKPLTSIWIWSSVTVMSSGRSSKEGLWGEGLSGWGVHWVGGPSGRWGPAGWFLSVCSPVLQGRLKWRVS